jgi:hypothetical protein
MKIELKMLMKELKESDVRAKFILMSSVTDNVLKTLVTTTAKDIWSSLKTRYGETTQANILVLRRNFLSMKQENDESVEKFIDRIKIARDEIDQNGSRISDEDTSMTILFGLLSTYETFVQLMTITSKTNDLEHVIKELLAEELRRKNKQTNNEKKHDEIVFHSHEKSKFNHKNKSNWNNKAKDKKCFNCNKFGHFTRNCRLPRANKTANYTEENATTTNEKFSFITDVDKTKLNSVWLLDSGATNHIACSKEIFKNIKPYKSTIMVGDGRSLKIKGIGEVIIKVESNDKIIELSFKNTLYVPDMNANLISIGQLAEKGCKITFENKKCLIRINEKHTIEGVRCEHNNKLYKLKIISKENYVANVVEGTNEK